MGIYGLTYSLMTPEGALLYYCVRICFDRGKSFMGVVCFAVFVLSNHGFDM